MCSSGSLLWQIVISAASGLIGAVIGGFIAYQVAEKPRRRKSNYDIADLFWKEADGWAIRPFSNMDPEMKIHNASINRLSPHVTYLRINHPEVCGKIWPHWEAYHGGDADTEITRKTYDRTGAANLGKDYWMGHLYQIADTLRDA